jgi:tRNA threonylcarbamoyladenosine biosynthesis protein TsaB
LKGSKLRILAFDTSTELCSCALWIDGEISLKEAETGRRHSELLLPMVETLLTQARLRVSELDGIAFGAGPGSFTGLRIACGVAQGLAFGAGLTVIGVSALLALAEGSGALRVIACIDARLGEIYHAAYEKRAGEWRTRSEPTLCSPARAPELSGEDWTGCGTGFAAQGEALGRVYQNKLSRVIPDALPHAREIAALAAPQFGQGLARDPALATPLYLRDKVALTTDERTR